MLRLLWLIALISAASAHFPNHFGHFHNHGGCHHRHGDHSNLEHTKEYHSKLFEEIANDVIEIDRKVQNFCTLNSNGGTTEKIEPDRYTLKTPMVDFQDSDLQLKIRQRVLYINAVKIPKRYSEIRLLPTIVDTKTASYDLVEGYLKISFNIKQTQTNNCNIVDDEIITVPQKSAPTTTESSWFGGDNGFNPRMSDN